MAPADGQGTALAEDGIRERMTTSNMLAAHPQSVLPSQMASSPVELTQFGQQVTTDGAFETIAVSTAAEPSSTSKQDQTLEPSSAREDLGITPTTKPSSPTSTRNSPLTRTETAPAIGSSSDKPTPIPKDSDLAGPTLIITLLLTSGARHPYKIDEKYLKKRGVNVESNDPVNMSVYTLKELIWREWRDGERSPRGTRLLIFSTVC